MSLASLLNTPCTITRRSASEKDDEFGNAIPDTDPFDTVCEIQRQDAVLVNEDSEGEPSRTDWLGIFPAGTDLDGGDSVMVEGEGEFELVGDPWRARNPRTQVRSHVQVSLRRVAGSESGS